jgi:hypothetical protein
MHDETTATDLAWIKQQSEVNRHLDSSWLRIFYHLPYQKRALMTIYTSSITYTTGSLVY